MTPLSSLNKYFWKYKWHFFLGMVFIILSNYFRILTPQITKYVLNIVEEGLKKDRTATIASIKTNYDPLVRVFISSLTDHNSTFKTKILYSGIILLVLAL